MSPGFSQICPGNSWQCTALPNPEFGLHMHTSSPLQSETSGMIFSSNGYLLSVIGDFRASK